MEYQFKKKKVRVMTISDQFPKGKPYLLNNVVQQFSFDQLTSLGEAFELVSGGKVVGYDVDTTDHVAVA